MTQREKLSVTEKLLLTAEESIDLQHMADDMVVSKSSLLRRGYHMIRAEYLRKVKSHDEKLSRLFPIPDTDE